MKYIIIGAIIVAVILFIITMIMTNQTFEQYYPKVCCEFSGLNDDNETCCETYHSVREGTCNGEGARIVDGMMCEYYLK